MNKNNRFCMPVVAGAVATALSAIAGTAAAASPGFYMAGTIGQSSIDIKSSDQEALDEILIDTWNELGFDVLDGDSDVEKTDIGFELALGYQISPYLAVEAAYIDLGQATYDAEGVVDNGTGPMDAETEITAGVKGPALSLVASWPFAGQWALDARAGALFGKSRLGVTMELDGEEVSESETDSKTSMFYGVGVSWSFSERTSLRLGYTHFPDGVADEFNVSRVSAGLKVSF